MTGVPVADLTGLRVLVVEDQMLVAMQIVDFLRGAGCVVVGPVGKLDSAVGLARTGALDAAVLDVNLDGQTVFPVADELQARSIPFVFTTGYGEAALPERWRAHPRLDKPYVREEVEEILRNVLTTAMPS